jgi:hypothetical protein
MKWNPATREYQEINTDESWREHWKLCIRSCCNFEEWV